jgi:F-type H+-transporting ATPase subunit b
MDGMSEHTATHASVGIEHKEPSPQLNPESFASQLFWLTLTFAALYLLISRSALPKIQSVVETRRQRLQADLEAAEALSRQAQEAQTSYETTLAESRLRANALIVEAQAAHDQMAKQEHAALDQTLAKKLAEADKSLREQCTRIERDMAPIAEEAATLIVEKLLGVSPDGARVKKAVKAASS